LRAMDIGFTTVGAAPNGERFNTSQSTENGKPEGTETDCNWQC